MRSISFCTAALLGATLLPSSSLAAEPYEGAWVTSPKHCKGNDGPNSLTVIDLKVNLDGKPVPMVEQYETPLLHRQQVDFRKRHHAEGDLLRVLGRLQEEGQRHEGDDQAVARLEGSAEDQRQATQALSREGVGCQGCKAREALGVSRPAGRSRGLDQKSQNNPMQSRSWSSLESRSPYLVGRAAVANRGGTPGINAAAPAPPGTGSSRGSR